MAMKRLANGLWAVPPRRREFFGIVHQLLPLGAGALGAADNVQVDGQADFLDFATATSYVNVAGGIEGEIKVQLVIQPDKYLFQAPVFIGALGTGFFPRYFASPRLIPRAQTYTLLGWDRQLVPAATNIRVLHIGQKQYDQPFEDAKAYRTVEPYDFVCNFTNDDGGVGALTAGLATANPINVFSDADFDIYKVSIIADGPAQIQVETSGKALLWFNRPVDIALLGGSQPDAPLPSGAWPFRLPSPCRVPAAGSIVTTIQDTSLAPMNRVQVIYHGIRMKPPGGLPVDPRSLVNATVATGA
jgi:hypothetical protein